MDVPPSPARIRRRVAWAALLPLSIAAGVLGAIAVAPLVIVDHFSFDTPPSPRTWRLYVIVVVTAGMAACAGAVALGGRSARSTGGRSIPASAVFGWLNAPLCLLATTTPGGEPFGPVKWFFGSMLLGLLLAAFVALPLGGLFGVVGAWPMMLVSRLRRQPTLDAVPRALRIAGATMVPTCLFGAFVASDANDSSPNMPIEVPLVLAAVGMVLIVCASASVKRRAAWVERVRRGEAPGWAIVEASSVDHDPTSLVRAGDRPAAGALLVRTLPPSVGGAYRESTACVPWARVRRSA